MTYSWERIADEHGKPSAEFAYTETSQEAIVMGPVDLPLILARGALAKTDDVACNRGWDDLVARYGHDIAASAWRQACAEMDAEVGQ